MDAFSQILSGVKLNGAVFFTAEFSSPWGFSTPARKVDGCARYGRRTPGALPPGYWGLLLNGTNWRFSNSLIEGGAVVELLEGQSIEL